MSQSETFPLTLLVQFFLGLGFQSGCFSLTPRFSDLHNNVLPLSRRQLLSLGGKLKSGIIYFAILF